MFIDRNYRPWLACATDDTRPALSHVLIERLSDVEEQTWGCNGVAVGANGYILVAVPVELEPDEGTCLLHRRFWSSLLRSCLVIKGRRYRGERAHIALGKAEDPFAHNVDGWAARKSNPADMSFPNWRGIVPAIPESPCQLPWLGVNPEYLAVVQRAIGAEHGAVLHFGERSSSPIMVNCLGIQSPREVRKPPFGIVMPMHLAWEKPPQPVGVGAASGAGDGS